MSLSAWSGWIVNCRSSFLGLLLAMLVQIWAVLSVTAMRFPGRTEEGGRSICRITRLPASTSCQGFGMPCLDLGLSDTSLRSLRSSCFSLGSQLRALGLLSMTLHGCSAADALFHVDSTDNVCTGGLSRTFCLRRIRRKVVGRRSTDCEPLCQKGAAFLKQVGRIFPSYRLRWSMWLWTLACQMVGGIAHAGSQM